MNKLAWSVAVVAASAMVVGCGSSSGGPGAPANPDTFVQEAASDFCQIEAKCGFIAQSELASCQAHAMLMPQGYDPNAAVTAGRLEYDQSAASTCLAGVTSATCSTLDLRKVGRECTQVAVGKVANGGACEADGECMSGYCTATRDGCMGTCMQYLGTGASCARDRQCGGDANVTHCAFGSSGSTCQPVSGAAGPCQDDTDCQVGLICFGTGGSGGTCANPLATGAACSLNRITTTDPCAVGLYCAFTSVSASPSGTCMARGKAGDQCQSYDGCQDGMTCKGWEITIGSGFSAMTVPGVCTAWEDAGQSCDNPKSMNEFLLQSGCTLDSPCDKSTNDCDVPGKAGAACGSGTPGCQPGFYCDGSACQADVAWGQSCSVPASGSDPCAQGTCEPTGKVCGLVCM